MSTLIVLQQMAVISLLVLIGVYLFKKDVVDSQTSKKLSAIVADICNPAIILASLDPNSVTSGKKVLLFAVVAGVVIHIFYVVLGAVMPLIYGVEAGKRKFYTMMMVYTNVGFIGIPVAKAVLPKEAMVYVIVCNVMYSLLFYTHGVTVLSSGKEQMNLLKVINPGTIAAVFSMVIFAFNIKLPFIIENTINYVGNATVFLSMVLLGVSIARSDIIKGFKNKKLWLHVVFRLLLVPMAVAFAVRGVGFSKNAALGFALMSGMPVGNLPLIQAEKTGEDTDVLSSAITVTTISSVATITILMSVLSNVL